MVKRRVTPSPKTAKRTKNSKNSTGCSLNQPQSNSDMKKKEIVNTSTSQNPNIETQERINNNKAENEGSNISIKVEKSDTPITQKSSMPETTSTLIQSFNSTGNKNTNFLKNKDIEVSQNGAVSLSSLSHQSGLQNEMHLPSVDRSATNVSHNWSSLQPDLFFNKERTTRNLDQFVKTYLFHMIVFISSPALVSFSRDAQSLCQIVCNELNIPLNDQEQFWMIYAKTVEQKLNKKRSDVSNAMKKTFKGMFSFVVFHSIVLVFV